MSALAAFPLSYSSRPDGRRLESHQGGLRYHPLMDDNLRSEAGLLSPARAQSGLLRQDLCAQLTTLNHCGLGGIGRSLADGLFALVLQLRHAMCAIAPASARC
jgi:hypothetical protein